MPREISDEINENRRQIGRAFARERIPSDSQESGLLLSPVPVSTAATVEVYTRPITDTALVGHPDAAQGWGRGRVGDYRGDWALQESVETPLTRDGRQAIADALVDGEPRLAGSSVGDAVVDAFGLDESATATRGRASFRFNESPDTVSSADLRTDDGRIIAEGSVTGVAADAQTEVRVDVTLAVSDDSRSDSESVSGLDVVADALRGDQPTLAEVALGTGTSAPSTGDTALDSETIRKSAAGQSQGPQAVAQTILFRGEPGTQPVEFTELGVVASDGSLVTRVVFASQEKDDRIRLRARNGLAIR